jgi:hypothetical protein
MRPLLSTVAALSLLLVGCTDMQGYGPDGPSVDTSIERDIGDDSEDPNTGPNNDDEPNSDDDPDNDPTQDDPSDGWDALPPDAPDGSVIHAVITCGLLDGAHDKTFEKSGDVWFETASSGNGVFEDLNPCMSRNGGGEHGDKWLRWDDEPSIYMNAAGLDHDLWPTDATDRWIGEVEPMNEPSRECVDNLAARGLTFPVTMTFEVLSVELH